MTMNSLSQFTNFEAGVQQLSTDVQNIGTAIDQVSNMTWQFFQPLNICSMTPIDDHILVPTMYYYQIPYTINPQNVSYMFQSINRLQEQQAFLLDRVNRINPEKISVLLQSIHQLQEQQANLLDSVSKLRSSTVDSCKTCLSERSLYENSDGKCLPIVGDPNWLTHRSNTANRSLPAFQATENTGHLNMLLICIGPVVSDRIASVLLRKYSYADLEWLKADLCTDICGIHISRRVLDSIKITIAGKSHHIVEFHCANEYVKEFLLHHIKISKPRGIYLIEAPMGQDKWQIYYKLFKLKNKYNSRRFTEVFCKGGEIFAEIDSTTKKISSMADVDALNLEDKTRANSALNNSKDVRTLKLKDMIESLSSKARSQESTQPENKDIHALNLNNRLQDSSIQTGIKDLMHALNLDDRLLESSTRTEIKDLKHALNLEDISQESTQTENKDIHALNLNDRLQESSIQTEIKDLMHALNLDDRLLESSTRTEIKELKHALNLEDISQESTQTENKDIHALSLNDRLQESSTHTENMDIHALSQNDRLQESYSQLKERILKDGNSLNLKNEIQE